MTEPLFVLDPSNDHVPVDSDKLSAGWSVTLPQHIKRHAVQAMRLRQGDVLRLSDGEGLVIRAEMVDAEQGTAKVLDFTRVERPVTRLALVQALAKNGHDEQAIDMATQIGVDAVVPWQADRCIAKWKAGRTDRKWDQVLVAATEQSRRAWKPQLQECASSKQIVALCRRACVRGDVVVVLHQDATDVWSGIESLVDTLSERCLADGKPRTVYVVVGPEGGIAESEVAAFADAGAHVCVLGDTILRASTAGAVALSLLSRALGRYA